MRQFHLIAFIILVIYLTSNLTAQEEIQSKRIQVQQNLLFQKWEAAQTPQEFIEIHKSEWGLSEKDNLIEKQAVTDFTGIQRIRYQQYHKGLPVIGAKYTLHQKNGVILKSSGLLYPYIECSTQAELPESHAAALAKAMAVRHAKLEHVASPEHLDITTEHAKLCIVDQAFPQHSGQYVLAYEVNVRSSSGMPIHSVYYINARDGAPIAHYSEICSHQKTVPASGYHYRGVEITVDSVNMDRFQLLDSARNIQINQVINNDPVMPQFETIWNPDNNWHYEEGDLEGAASDAMYCSAAYYDMLQSHFNRDGIDGLNGPMICNVNVPSFSGGYFFSNAYWDGATTNYGAGDCRNYGPFTTLSIVSHEFTHGLTDYTSDLVYSGESGALNESMSDIFGETLEYYADSADFSWAIGSKLVVEGSMSEPIRNMQDPHLQDNPKYYKGQFWDRSEGVHTNSGVMNHWYYLIAVGGADTNEVGYVYDLEGMGIDKAIQIAYLMQTAYLTPTSNYAMAYVSSISAAEDLFGEGSPEVSIVDEAWRIVGVIDRQGPQQNLSVQLASSSILSPICLETEEVYIYVVLENRGLDTIQLDNEIGFKVRFGFGFNPLLEDTAVLNPNIELPPGESMEVELRLMHKGQLTFDNLGGLGKIIIEMLRPDEYLSDNMIDGFGVYASTQIDLNVLEVEASFDGKNCNNESISALDIIYENNSCDLLPQGSMLQFTFTNGSEEYTLERPALLDVGPAGISFQFLQITENMFEDYYGPVQMILRYESDNNPENDTILIGNWRQQAVDTQLLSFTLDNETKYLQLQNEVPVPTTYLNDQWLAFTNGSDEFLDYTTCYEGVEEHFDRNTPSKGRIGFCVDTRGDLEASKLLFNAVFFDAYDTASLIPEHFATMFDVQIDGERQDLIYQQEEGEIHSYEYPIPEDFVGSIEINVSAYQRDESMSHALGSKAWVLFDDFRIEGVTASEDIQQDLLVSVYPNPASDQILLDVPSSFDITGATLFDLLGKQVRNYNGANTLDISTISEGTYFLQIRGAEEQIVTKKLIIQR